MTLEGKEIGETQENVLEESGNSLVGGLESL